MLWTNSPGPVPSTLVESVVAVLGLAVERQHTPLAVTGLPPSEAIFPPVVAEVAVMTVAGVVVSWGNTKRGGESGSILVQPEVRSNKTTVKIDGMIRKVPLLKIDFDVIVISYVFIV